MLIMKGFHVSASGAIQGHHGPLVIVFHRTGGCDFDMIHSSLTTNHCLHYGYIEKQLEAWKELIFAEFW